MDYPTIEEINAANRMQLCRWWRFLPCDRLDANFEVEKTAYDEVKKRLRERLDEVGWFTPDISKAIGWKEA